MNIYLILKLSPATWIRFAVWMVAGNFLSLYRPEKGSLPRLPRLPDLRVLRLPEQFPTARS